MEVYQRMGKEDDLSEGEIEGEGTVKVAEVVERWAGCLTFLTTVLLFHMTCVKILRGSRIVFSCANMIMITK